MTTRVRYAAEYFYPGFLFPESVRRDIQQPTWETVLALAPREDGYFKVDDWYAVTLTAITEKRYVADDDNSDGVWIVEHRAKVHSWIVGEKVHVDDPSISGDDHAILRSNIRCNSTDGYAVRTRSGNWQIAGDWDTVVAPESVAA